MNTQQNNGLRFAIAPIDGGWTWETFDLQGQSVSRGVAGSRREAAAFVIRETILSCLPQPEAQRLAA